jgi:hypothetical protein
MLKVNVGLSRKLSKDYQSTGYSVNLEGEIMAPVSDPEAVIEQVKEVFDLAEAALDAQIERSQGAPTNAGGNEEPRGRQAPADNSQRTVSGNGNSRKDEPATNKQISYLLSIGKRQRLTTAALEKEVADILGQEVGFYDLTKKQAGIVIDQLTTPAGSNRA